MNYGMCVFTELVFISNLKVFRAWRIIQWQKESRGWRRAGQGCSFLRTGEKSAPSDFQKCGDIHLHLFHWYCQFYTNSMSQRWSSCCCWALTKNKANNLVVRFMNCIVEKDVLCLNFYPSTIIIFHITGNYFRTQKNSNIAKLPFVRSFWSRA